MKQTTSKKEKKKSSKAAQGVATSPADLAALAQELLAQQRAIRERIPDFVLPHASRQRLAGTAARVTDLAVNEGLAACVTHVTLSGAIDADAVRYGQDYEHAFMELRDEMQKTFEGLDYSIRLKRHNNGQAMLRILALARSLAKAPENADLAVHIAAMEKEFRRRRHHPPVPQPTPPGAPAHLLSPPEPENNGAAPV